MPDVPFVGILVAETRQVRAGPFRSPEHRMIVFGFDGKRIRTVKFDFIPQRPDHLRMAGVATFADVDVTACALEPRVQPHTPGVFARLMCAAAPETLEWT